MEFTISTLSWKFWFAIILLIIFIIWVFFGGQHGKLNPAHRKAAISQSNPTLTSSNDKHKPTLKHKQKKQTDEFDNTICETTEFSIAGDESNDRSDESDLTSKHETSEPTTICVDGSYEEAIAVNQTPEIPSDLHLYNIKPIKQKDKINALESDCPYKIWSMSGKKSKGEDICKITMEQLYGKPFYTIRPDFLKNPETGKNLELDCYNHELKMAVEFNGIQHYVWPNFTGQTKDEFINQIRRDEFKVRSCDANGIYLITVPYNVPHNLIRDYLVYYLPDNVQRRLEDTK